MFYSFISDICRGDAGSILAALIAFCCFALVLIKRF
jgi:hypothetical protein